MFRPVEELELAVDATDVATRHRPAASLRSGPIVASFLAWIGLFVLLTLLAAAVGATALPATANPPAFIVPSVAALIALVSFFTGGVVRVVLPRHDWAYFVRLGLEEIRLAGADNPRVIRRPDEVVDDLVDVAAGERRARGQERGGAPARRRHAR